ncbi:hypothetical protein DSM25558_4172 [Agrobacterium sp. DSM 25558]|uniref:hypothetical protein n=1 Tax=Agrobacterium sp. DSM 25558 TaxID=1907665 RepID=UPI00097247DD|nr:hypothetical protein [Agrobacterium sp. DSM 25558]SCX27182.1 hypothetical protein DSM25558_4172 [Agrobacterium sp. DSM 25558]
MLKFFGSRSRKAVLADEIPIPDWFIPRPPLRKPNISLPYFLYQSWIPEHTDKLISLLQNEGVSFQNLSMFSETVRKSNRVDILRFAEQNDELYRRMCLHSLAPHRESAIGLVVTLDWIPAMRTLVECASLLGLKTFLVPHESVFAKSSMYYTHPKLGINCPATDVIFAWGNLQRDIFVERGYPRADIEITGTPKFDYLFAPKRHQQKKLISGLGLDPNKFLVVAIAQPLDSQFNQTEAQRAQELAFSAVSDWVSASQDRQLLIRMPPARGQIFSSAFVNKIKSQTNASIDDSSLFLLTPEQTVLASDVIVSVNSTMLLEAALNGKAAISAKFLEFEQIWDNVHIAVAKSQEKLVELLNTAMADPGQITKNYNFSWAEKALSNGKFDGRAAMRVAARLKSYARI